MFGLVSPAAFAAALGLAVAAPLVASPARAQSMEEVRKLAEAATAVALQTGVARGVVALCDERDPSRAAERRAVFEAWAARNRLARYEALVAAMKAQEAMAEVQAKMRDVLRQAVEQDDSVCAHTETFLAGAELDLRPGLDQALRLAGELGMTLEGGSATPPPRTEPADPPAPRRAEARRLSQFSAEALRIMARVAPAREDMDSETRDAREDALLQALEASGGRVALYGRVTARDEMREWTEEAQSVFEVECRDFADRRHKTLMEASLGENMILSGEARRVFDAESGTRAVLYLDDCEIAAPEAAGAAALGAPADEGLTLRPPSEEEAWAGPGLGIAMKDVDRVLYDARFDSRLDGFGNLYTDRDEDIYVLLKDGSSYQHGWSFPFTDLNLELSKRREPEKWGRWSERRGVVSLQAYGAEVDLERAQRLLSPKPGTRLEHVYYYLNVGMGGGRSDAGLTLHADGRIERSRGGFVAANLAAGGFLAVVGPDQPILRGRYRFEDFALVAQGEDGREDRIFFGVPENEDLSDPDSVVVGGAVYWTRDED